MQYKRFRTLLILGISALVLVGCGSSATPDPQEAVQETAQEVQEVVDDAENETALAMTAWTLESMGSPEDNLGVIEGTRPSLNFLISDYVGSGGCNWFQAAYNIVGEDELDMALPNQTRVTCEEPEGIMSQDETFIGAVTNATSYVLENDQLKLYTVGDQLMATLGPAEPVPFEGNAWSLKFISDGEDLNPVLMSVEVTALFEDGQVTGSAGCNTYSGSYELDGRNLTIGPLDLTANTCEDPEGVMLQEDVYVTALGAVAGYDVVGGVMVLTDEMGETLLGFSVK